MKSLRKKTQQNKDSDDSSNNATSWHCNPDICKIEKDMITGTVTLLRQISSVHPTRRVRLYCDMNQCQNPNRTDRLGHPVNCRLDCNCSSLLRPARLLSCHFPVLRDIIHIIHKIYEIRRTAVAVKKAMGSGCFDELKATLQHLRSS